jgi:hypothetical protein
MNAPFVIPATGIAPSEAVYLARCEARALLFINGQLSLHEAVDELQAYAEQSGLVDAIGQDEAQAIMSWAFCAVDIPPEPEEFQNTADTVRRWELADPRDAWLHTGEAPPPEIVRNSDILAKPVDTPRSYRTPQASLSAFWYVASLNHADYLKRWLAEHPRDVTALQKLWEAKHACS